MVTVFADFLKFFPEPKSILKEEIGLGQGKVYADGEKNDSCGDTYPSLKGFHGKEHPRKSVYAQTCENCHSRYGEPCADAEEEGKKNQGVLFDGQRNKSAEKKSC